MVNNKLEFNEMIKEHNIKLPNMPARFADAPADARKAVWHDRQFFFVSVNQIIPT